MDALRPLATDVAIFIICEHNSHKYCKYVRANHMNYVCKIIIRKIINVDINGIAQTVLVLSLSFKIEIHLCARAGVRSCIRHCTSLLIAIFRES